MKKNLLAILFILLGFFFYSCSKDTSQKSKSAAPPSEETSDELLENKELKRTFSLEDKVSDSAQDTTEPEATGTSQDSGYGPISDIEVGEEPGGKSNGPIPPIDEEPPDAEVDGDLSPIYPPIK